MNKLLAVLSILAGIVIPAAIAELLFGGMEMDAFVLFLCFIIGFVGMQPFAMLAMDLWFRD